PYGEIGEFRKVDGFVAVVLRNQEGGGEIFVKAADQQFTIEYGYHHPPFSHAQRAIHYQDIIVEYPRVAHGIALHAEKKGGGLVADQLLIEVDPPFHIIISRGAKAGSIGGGHFMLRKLFAAA